MTQYYANYLVVSWNKNRFRKESVVVSFEASVGNEVFDLVSNNDESGLDPWHLV